MNVRLSGSISGLTRQFRVLSLKRCKDPSWIVKKPKDSGNGRKLSLSDLHDCQSKTVNIVFHDPLCERGSYRTLPPFALTLSRLVDKFRQSSWHSSLTPGRRLHTSSRHPVYLTPAASQRTASQPDSSHLTAKKRLPLSQPQLIQEVLSEHSEVLQEFAAVLGCSEAAMRDMVRRDTRLLTQFSKDAVITKMRLLLDHGFSPTEILSRYQVFSRSLHHIQSRLRAMAPVRHYRYSMAILLLSHADFAARLALYQREVAVMGEHSSQTSFLAELLECTEEDVASMAKERHQEFLLTLPPSRLQESVAVLRSFGLTLADIRRKALVLRCPPQVALSRLQRMRDAGVFNKALVASVLTNCDAYFRASLKSWVNNAEALGSHANGRELLMHRLQCSEEEVESLMKRNCRIASMSSAKIMQCLDVLEKEVGLSSRTILRNGSLLYYSPRRLQTRWALLKSFDLSETARAQGLRLSEQKFMAKYGCESH